MWSKYDRIASISDDVTVTFLKKFPSLKSKIVLMENVLSKAFIDEQAEAFSIKNEMPDGSVKLLSIGRFCEAKNFDNVPEIASVIKLKGIDFKWYIIGFGADENLIKSKITEYKMEDTVIIPGKRIILIRTLKRAMFMFSRQDTRENPLPSGKHKFLINP